MSTRKALGVIAGLVLLVGLILGFVPTSISAGSDDVGCGSAFHPGSGSAEALDFIDGLEDSSFDGSAGYVARCDDRVSTQRLIVWPLVGIGGAVLLFLTLTGQKGTRWDPPATSAEGSESSSSSAPPVP